MKFEQADLLKRNLIPKEELDRVFTQSYSAAAEMDRSFLCFEKPYLNVLKHTTKDSIVIDLGCGYAAQSFYFTHCHYIGVDLPMPGEDEVRFTPPNATCYVMSIQKFIQEILPELHLDMDKVIAVCSAVPDEEAQQMVIDTFPRHYVSYPGMQPVSSLDDIEAEYDIDRE